MGKLIEGRFGQSQAMYEAFHTQGKLALAGPPNEPPWDPSLKRHLRLVPADTFQSTQPKTFDEKAVVYDLNERRKQKKSHKSVVIPILFSRFMPSPEPPRIEPVKPVFSEPQTVFTSEKPKEHFFTKEWMQEEVAKVKKEPIQSGETPWWHLSGTGFWVKEQAAQLIRNLKKVGKEAFPDVLKREISKYRIDIEHFEREYLKQMASLQWQLAWQERDGQKRIVCPEYKGGGKDSEGSLWESVTSKEEREGIVYGTLFGKGGVEDTLRTATPGTSVIVSSPAGWSGYKDIAYPEAQFYMIQVQSDGSLKAYTFRSDANIIQIEAMQKKLGLTVTETADQKQRIKNTMANVAYITPEDNDQAEQEGRKPLRTFEDFVDLLQESVGGGDVAYGEGKDVKTFDEIKRFIRSPESYTSGHELTSKLSDRFADYATWRFSQGGTWEEIEQDIQIAMAFGPLHLNKAYRIENRQKGHLQSITGGKHEDIQQLLASGTNYENEAKKLQELPGCAGGGKSKTYVNSLGTVRVGGASGGISSGGISSGGGEDYEFNEYGDCVVCHDGPKSLGPCKICISCDAKMGGKGALLLSGGNAPKTTEPGAQVYNIADFANTGEDPLLKKAS